MHDISKKKLCALRLMSHRLFTQLEDFKNAMVTQCKQIVTVPISVSAYIYIHKIWEYHYM